MGRDVPNEFLPTAPPAAVNPSRSLHRDDRRYKTFNPG
jgi:hypothetical protein